MTREDLELVLSTFAELRRRELAAHGRFVTANRVLNAWDNITA
jgi:hypothetical protein